jgi:class 3 adenylate cyclase
MAENMIALIFTDLVNSTAIKNHLAGSSIRERNEAYRDSILLPHRQRVTESLSQYEGRVVEEMGDAFFLVFPNAILAAQWAVAAQNSHIAEPIPTPLGNLCVRIGMHIGAPLVDGDQFIGQEVDYAARVAALAAGEQILLSENAAAFVRSAEIRGITLYSHGEMYLKGIGFGAVPIFELLYAERAPLPLKVAGQKSLSNLDAVDGAGGSSSELPEILALSANSQELEQRSLMTKVRSNINPETSWESPEGQVPIDSRFYIPSAYEERCYEEVKKPGSLIRIKSPHCMGKSSLMIRVLAHAKQLGYRTVSLNLEEVNQRIFTDLEQFMQWFCATVGKQLGIRMKTEEYWDDIFGANDNTTDYFENYLLKVSEQPLVLAIDNFDRVFKYADIETDFCGLLRGWYERSRSNLLWGNLRLVIVHSQEPYLPKDINQSPFNVGLAIKLGEFTTSEVQVLIARHELGWTEQQVGDFLGLIGGHPYLVRSALYHIASGDVSLEEFLRIAPTEAGIYSRHLLGHLSALEDYPELAAAMKTVVTSENPVRLRSEEAFKLDSRGLIVRVDNDVVPRCLLYRLYFCDRLGV